MRRHRSSRLLLLLGSRGRRGLALAERLSLRLEGGQLRSLTQRDLLRATQGVDLGEHSYGVRCDGRFAPGTSVGRYVSVGPGVRVFHRNHPVHRAIMHPYFYNAALGLVSHDTIESSELRIEHDAWLGADAIVVPGVRRIGIGAVVAAGAIVTKDVGDFEIVGGNPAKRIGMRFEDDTAARILASRWWEREPSDLRDVIGVLSTRNADDPAVVAALATLVRRESAAASVDGP